jgi:chorismate-pyruvate lyase
MLVNMNAPLTRRRYSPHAEHASFLRLLLTHDGSTTRLCEAVNGAPIRVYLHEQHIVDATTIPAEVAAILGGTQWLQRLTSLHTAAGDVFMDNLSFTRLDAVPTWFLDSLNDGKTPIGCLLDQLFIKRIPTATSATTHDLLWQCVGMVDETAARSYFIATEHSPFMLIYEVFRDGVRVAASNAASSGSAP